MSSSEFDEKRKTCDTVIIPVGATEVYGPHLPMGSDILVAQAVAEKVADQVNAMIGPSLEVGESYSLSKYPGTLYLRPETWKSVVEDFMVSLMKWGFKKFMFINGHAGNVPIIGQLDRTSASRSHRSTGGVSHRNTRSASATPKAGCAMVMPVNAGPL